MTRSLILDLSIFGIQAHGGISVVWAEYLKGLPKYLHQEFCVSCRVPESVNPVLELVDLNVYKIENVLKRGRYSKYLPNFILGSTSDLLHMSYYSWYPFFRGQKIVTVHDFTHEYFASGLQQKMHTILKRIAIDSCDAIICISQATRNDLEKFFPEISKKKIVRVIPNAVSGEFYRDTADGEDFGAPYFLWVGGRAGYKNFAAALSFVGYLRKKGQQIRLVVVGAELSKEESRTIASNKLDDVVAVRTRIDQDALRKLYSNAAGLLYLSKYEGFGLPILEAQRCHCPVVCLRTPSALEIGASSVIYLDEITPQTASSAFARLLDLQKRTELILSGEKNADRFSWDNSVSQLADLYSELSA